MVIGWKTLTKLKLLPRDLALLDGAETCRRAVVVPLLEDCSWFGVWWSLQCIVGATVTADGSAVLLLLSKQTPVTVASAAPLQWS